MTAKKAVKQAEDLETIVYQPEETHKGTSFSKAQFLASQAYSLAEMTVSIDNNRDFILFAKPEHSHRITSYNVCYTKLLRMFHPPFYFTPLCLN